MHHTPAHLQFCIKTNRHYCSYFDDVVSNGFFPKITLPTRLSDHSSTLIDNIFTNNIDEASTSGILLTLSDPGYFRQLTIRGGALKAPPYDLENYCVNLHHIIYVNFTRCFWHDPIRIFQKFAILTVLQRFQNKK